MLKPLRRLTITPDRAGYRLHLETDAGETFEVSASFEQLDLIAEEIDRRLDADDEGILPLGSMEP
jgi:hypothetical protein